MAGLWWIQQEVWIYLAIFAITSLNLLQIDMKSKQLLFLGAAPFRTWTPVLGSMKQHVGEYLMNIQREELPWQIR